jgi:hypothetical protein
MFLIRKLFKIKKGASPHLAEVLTSLFDLLPFVLQF